MLARPRAPQVGTFWDSYCHIVRADKLALEAHISCFKEGVTPTWEDEANSAGGKWMLGVDKKATVCLWERLLLALVGNQFGDDTEHVCGIVLRVRYGQDLLSIWTDNAEDHAAQQRIKDTAAAIMGLPHGIADNMYYRPHGRHSEKPRSEGRGGGGGGARTAFPFQGGRGQGRDAAGPARGARGSKPAFGSWRSSGGGGGGGGGRAEPAAQPARQGDSDFGSWRRGPAPEAPVAEDSQAPARKGSKSAREGRGSRHNRSANVAVAAEVDAGAPAGSAAPAPAPAPQSRHLLALKRTGGEATDSSNGGPSPTAGEGSSRRRGVPRGAPSKLGTA